MGSSPGDDDVEFVEEASFGAEDEEAYDAPSDYDGGAVDYADDAGEDLYAADFEGEEAGGDFVDDAGDGASYGYEAVAETRRFDGTASGISGLADDAALPDEDDQYAPDPDDDGPADLDYAEDAGVGSGDEEFYPDAGAFGSPAEGLDESEYAEDAGDGASYAAPPSDGYAGTRADGYEAEGYDDGGAQEAYGEGSGYGEDYPAESAQESPDVVEVEGFSSGTMPAVEDDVVQDAEKPASRRSSASSRSGQVPKSALEEIFARAAELKRGQ